MSSAQGIGFWCCPAPDYVSQWLGRGRAVVGDDSGAASSRRGDSVAVFDLLKYDRAAKEEFADVPVVLGNLHRLELARSRHPSKSVAFEL
jgi:hypothetical protein